MPSAAKGCLMPGPQELPSRAQYDAWWEHDPFSDRQRAALAEEIARNPDNIRRHAPDPAWVELCQRAEEWGLQVFLSIKRGGPLGPPGRTFRPFDTVTLRAKTGYPPVLQVDVSSMTGGLHSAAMRALEKLEAA